MSKEKKTSPVKSAKLPKSESQSNSKEKNQVESSVDKHPKQHLITVVMTDKKTKFQILTSWGKEGDVLNLDVDPLNHPAWQEKGQSFVNTNDERVNKFKNKFGNFDFVGNKS
jgi:large subunit ribosomal protein L31